MSAGWWATVSSGSQEPQTAATHSSAGSCIFRFFICSHVFKDVSFNYSLHFCL